ncbi:MAG TPA: hypothetical protein VK835_04740 [Bacteroidia bacterium]|nr:hypothetical protein [Bacteroidia bacterium]
MKEFLYKIAGFFVLVILVLALSLYYIPDVVARTSMLAAIIDKHEALNKIKTEKIVFVGGSNLSFGLDSKKIVAAYKKPVINMGVHAGIGLEYIMNDVKAYINRGDVVVLVPEYENFYTDNFYGEMELVSVLFDIDPAGRKHVNAKQWEHLLKYIPTYSAKKIKNYIPTLFHKSSLATEIDIYDRRSFNEFGDAYIHWVLPNQNYMPSKRNSGNEKINLEVIEFIKNFKEYVEGKGAKLVMLPPVIEEQSYNNQDKMINEIEAALAQNNIGFMVKPDTYKFTADYFFNSYYHLNKKGVDKRTEMVIGNLATALR